MTPSVFEHYGEFYLRDLYEPITCLTLSAVLFKRMMWGLSEVLLAGSHCWNLITQGYCGDNLGGGQPISVKSHYSLVQYKIALHTTQHTQSKTAQKKPTTLICPINEFVKDIHTSQDLFVDVPSHWEMTLQCKVVSHWLGTSTKWSLAQILGWVFFGWLTVLQQTRVRLN